MKEYQVTNTNFKRATEGLKESNGKIYIIQILQGLNDKVSNFIETVIEKVAEENGKNCKGIETAIRNSIINGKKSKAECLKEFQRTPSVIEFLKYWSKESKKI